MSWEEREAKRAAERKQKRDALEVKYVTVLAEVARRVKEKYGDRVVVGTKDDVEGGEPSGQFTVDRVVGVWVSVTQWGNTDTVVCALGYGRDRKFRETKTGGVNYDEVVAAFEYDVEVQLETRRYKLAAKAREDAVRKAMGDAGITLTSDYGDNVGIAGCKLAFEGNGGATVHVTCNGEPDKVVRLLQFLKTLQGVTA